MPKSSKQEKLARQLEQTELDRQILLIDDTPAIHEDIRKVFAQIEAVSPLNALENELFGKPHQNSHIHYQIDSAYQGLEGYKKVRQAIDHKKPYSLAIIDIRMSPGWNGLKTIKEIWKVDNEIQIIICTAYCDYEWTDIKNELGINDRLLILKKPFDNIELIQMVNTSTEKWALSRKVKKQLSHMDSLVDKRTKELRAANKTLTYQATHDSLTNLVNRHELERCLTLAVDSPPKEVIDYSLCYMDLDHFKKVNDISGHLAGDELLKIIANILKTNVREQDVVARMGGDEFILLLKFCPEQAALKITQSILKTIDDLVFEWEGQSFNVGISIGLVHFTNNKVKVSDLIKSADSACYKAKANGRNQIVSAHNNQVT